MIIVVIQKYIWKQI